MDGRDRTITLLGQVAIAVGTGGSESTTWRGRRAEFVFAYLVAEHDRLVTQSELAEALWPERLPETWEAALRGVMTEVRRFVSDGGLDPTQILTTVRHGYRMRLPDGITVDLDEARGSLAGARASLTDGAASSAAASARRASELARLPFLPNHEGPWVDGIRRELESINARGLELEARAHALAGDLAAANEAAARLVQAEPFNETAHQLRIRLLGEAGDRAGAVVAFEHCRDVLATDLGVEPSAETHAAYRAALENAVSVGAQRPSAVPSSAPEPVTSEGLGSMSMLVVEDHDFQRRTALMLLRNLGVGTLLEAADGLSAMELLGPALRPDVILCDIDMPGMDGLEFITHVAEQELAGAVIIASALDAKVIDAVRTVGEGYGLQVLGALEKPLTARRLGELLASYRPRTWKRSTADDAGEGTDSITGAEVRSALDDGRVVFHLQPGVDVASGRLTTANAVPTMLGTGGGFVSSEALVRAVAGERLLPQLSRLALQAACGHVADFASKGLTVKISVALAPDSLHVADLAVEAGDIARARGVDPAMITFGLDERALRSAPSTAFGVLTRLRVKGFGVALANFGTRNTPADQLRALPFTEVVLASTLLRDAAGDPEQRRTLEDTVQLGRELGVAVVGSGCASEDDLRLLLEVGCDRITGDFIATAMPAGELPDWVAQWDPERLGGGLV